MKNVCRRVALRICLITATIFDDKSYIKPHFSK